MSTRQYLEERRKKDQKRKSLMLGFIIGGSLLVVTAIALAIISVTRVTLSPRQIIQPEISTSIQSNRNTLGDPDAPVVIEEFSDFGCTHCASFALETKKLLEEEYIKEGKVYLVFHSVGSLLGSSATVLAAEAAYCAGDQDAFWPYHDLVFANQLRLFQNRDGNISPSLGTFAEVLDLDQDQFNSCLSSGKFQSLVSQDLVLAKASNVTGTPSFLINGNFFQGNQPIENFRQIIEEELAK